MPASCADVTDVVQEFVAGLPAEAAAASAYLQHQAGVASSLAAEAAAALSAAAAAALADAAVLGASASSLLSAGVLILDAIQQKSAHPCTW